MDRFLIFLYEILKLQIFFLISGLTQVIPCNPGPGSLVGSTPELGLITMLEAIVTMIYCPSVLLASIAI